MITSVDTLIAALSTAETLSPAKYGASSSAVAGYWNSSWRMTGTYQAAVPPTGSGEACTRTNPSIGPLPFTEPSGSQTLHVARLLISPNQAIGCYLYDRLVHTSGLSGTVATEQIVSSSALPARITDAGAGAEIWLEWYTTTGSTSVTVTASYTNSNSVSGRTTQTITIPASMRQTAMIRLPLQAGDSGVKSVESVTLSATTGTAGNFGVTIQKRIVSIPGTVANSLAGQGPVSLGLPPVDGTACLYFVTPGTTTTSPTYDVEITFIKV